MVITARMLLSVFETTTMELFFAISISVRKADKLIKEELYQGTSKGAEGYAACLTFKKAKDEGMNIAVQWQDADSSSSKAVTDYFPNAKVMICGGHASRAHKKQLEKQKIKSFTVDTMRKYKDGFPSVGDVVCHCSRHKQGCGCLSKTSKGREITFR